MKKVLKKKKKNSSTKRTSEEEKRKPKDRLVPIISKRKRSLLLWCAEKKIHEYRQSKQPRRLSLIDTRVQWWETSSPWIVTGSVLESHHSRRSNLLTAGPKNFLLLLFLLFGALETSIVGHGTPT